MDLKLTQITVRERMPFRGWESETIAVEQQEAALNSLRRGEDPFTNKDLQAALRKQGVGEAAYRCADRLLQKLRKQGVIQFNAGFWTFLK